MEDDKQLIQKYVEKKRNGVDYSEIRKELASKGLEKEKISELIRKMDEVILEENTVVADKKRLKQNMLVGMGLMIFGGIVTIGTYYNWFYFKNIYIIAWGPVIVGYFMVVQSRRKQKRANRKFNI